MDSKARIEKRAVYPVGRREVWAAITKPDELSRWFGSEVVALDLRPGGTALTVVETPWVPVGEPVHVAPVIAGAPGSMPDPPGAPPRIMLRARVRV